jgi:hypothetical protein
VGFILNLHQKQVQKIKETNCCNFREEEDVNQFIAFSSVSEQK